MTPNPDNRPEFYSWRWHNFSDSEIFYDKNALCRSCLYSDDGDQHYFVQCNKTEYPRFRFCEMPFQCSGYVEDKKVYAMYERKAYWGAVKHLVKGFDESKPVTCADCGRAVPYREVHIHHPTYKHMGRERQEDVVALCPACHRERHKALRKEAHHDPE